MTEIESVVTAGSPGLKETIVLEKFDKDKNLRQRNTVVNGVLVNVEYFPPKEEN